MVLALCLLLCRRVGVKHEPERAAAALNLAFASTVLSSVSVGALLIGAHAVVTQDPSLVATLVLYAVLLLPSIACMAYLWLKQPAGIGRKLFWSVVIALPLLGPMFYGALFRPLPRRRSLSAPEEAAELAKSALLQSQVRQIDRS